MTNSGNGVYGFSPRSAKPRGSYPPHILQDEVIHVGSVHDHGGFADVSNGE